jgi:aryl-alcohol dehydrogenase-like predicted oxidoreductase
VDARLEPRPQAARHAAKNSRRKEKSAPSAISTPEHDQNSLIDLMRGGWLDCVQVIYNIFEQEPQAEFFPAAREHNVGVIVRVAFDESALTGKLTQDTKWSQGDFRNNYFAGDRLTRTIARVEKVKVAVGRRRAEPRDRRVKICPQDRRPVSTVIPGIRNVSRPKRTARSVISHR